MIPSALLNCDKSSNFLVFDLSLVAPNNATPKTSAQCAAESYQKNKVALAFDAAGVFAGQLPGGALVVASAQATVSVASGVHSAMNGQAIGSALGVLGLPATFTGYAAKALGVGGRFLPEVGTIVSVVGGLADGYSAYSDYENCLAGKG